MPKRLLSGIVVSSKSDKTIVVKVTRRVKHKLYKKIISRSKKYHVHDEKNSFKIGDTVSIIETKPISKLKTWTIYESSGDKQWFKCNQNFLLLTIQELEKFNA